MNRHLRPAWFFDPWQTVVGILIDIAVSSHQIDQFLHFTGADDAVIVARASVPSRRTPGRISGDPARARSGQCGYIRVDWFTPDGLSNGAMGPTILGTGYIELRKIHRYFPGVLARIMIWSTTREVAISTVVQSRSALHRFAADVFERCRNGHDPCALFQSVRTGAQGSGNG